MAVACCQRHEKGWLYRDAEDRKCLMCGYVVPPAELLDIPERELHKQRLYQTRKRIIEEAE